MRSLYNVAVENNAIPATVLKEIERRIQAHTGKRIATWEVSCAMMGTADKKKPPLHIISTSEAPGQRFVVTNGILAEVGEGFPQVLRKISRYEQRSVRAVRGHVYDFIDLYVRTGLSFDKGSPVGVVVEVEYRPSLFVDDCANLMSELMSRITAPLISPPHAGQDPSANAAATTAYSFERVTVDIGATLPDEPILFSHRHASLLYMKLLG